ncbi:MAG: efflux RND transporter permease subunit [Gemmatimonadota bacterium]
MKAPVAWMARNHVAANLLMVFVLATGVLGVLGIKKETFPEISLDTVSISVPYLGATPADVEEGVCQRIEERLIGMEHVRRIRSTAVEGLGVVTVELELGAPVDQVIDDIRNEVDRIDTFPAETEKPVIKELIRRNRVVDVVVYGAVPERALKVAAERVRDELRATATISQVELLGVRTDEISVEVSEQGLQRHGLTLAQVADAVRRTSLDLPGGSVKGEDGEILVRTQGLRHSAQEYEDVVVLTRPDGTALTLGQIGTVADGFEDSDLISRFDGLPAAIVEVYRTGDQSALEISDTVKEYVAASRARQPAGISLDYVRDDARLLRGRLDLLLSNACMGLALVFIVLSLFLDLRLAFWVILGIPISFLGSFLLIQPFDVSVNMLSLFAFIVALGIVVDDAIVVGENVYAHRERGKGLVRAAVDGTLEVGTPVVFSVLTTVAAFVPLAFVEGMMGKFMLVIPVIVISVLMVSLVEALFILPAHLSSEPGPLSRWLGRVFWLPLKWHDDTATWVNRQLRAFIDGPYARSLEIALARPLATAALGLALMLVTLGWIAGGHIKFVFMPKIDSDWVTISVVMPQGTTSEQTAAAVERIERAAMQVRDQHDAAQRPGHPSVFRNITTMVGDQPTARSSHMGAAGGVSSQSHLAEITIELLPAEEREVGSSEIANRVRDLAGEIPGAESVSYRGTLFTVGNPIEVELASRDFPQLLQAVERLKGEVAGYPGTSDIQDSFQEGKLEMKLALKPQARVLGLTLADLARQVRQGFYGEQAVRFQRGRDDVRVMVRYPEAERRALGDIESMRIRTPAGDEVPFSYVADVSLGYGFSAIQRTDGQRVVTVSADVDEAVANADEINRDLESRFLPALGLDYLGVHHTMAGEQRERADSFASLGKGFAVALLAIYVLLAIPFRSYLQPLVIMSAIPFGMIGAVWGHALMGLDLAMLSMFGVVALSGVVVNDSLVLLSFYNQLRAEGLGRDEALAEAGKQRFRPILLTSLTTFFALLPMIMERSVQAQFLIPMAVSLGFGILFSTAITLVGVPAAMKLVALAQERLQGRGEAAPLSGPPSPAVAARS